MTPATRPVMRTHIDVCGPFERSVRGFKYYLSITDDFTKKSELALLRHKSEVLERLQEYEAHAVAEKMLPMVYLRMDNAGENTSKAFKAWLAAKGIRAELTIPRTPHEDAVSERFNRTVGEKGRSLLHDGGLRTAFWCFAVEMANYLKIRSPTTSQDVTPYDILKYILNTITIYM